MKTWRKPCWTHLPHFFFYGMTLSQCVYCSCSWVAMIRHLISIQGISSHQVPIYFTWVECGKCKVMPYQRTLVLQQGFESPTLWFTVQRLTCIHWTASPLRFGSCTLFESTCVPLMIMVTKIHIIRTLTCTLWFSVKRLIHWTTTPLYGYKLYLSWKCL